MTTPLMKPSAPTGPTPASLAGAAQADRVASGTAAYAEDRELVRRIAAGDTQAFETFSDDYIPALYRFALSRLGRDEDLAEEIVQTTLVKVVAKLDSFRGDAALMTWLCACCRMEIAGHFRRKGRRPREVELSGDEDGGEAPLNATPPESPDRATLSRERRDLVHATLDLLPPHYGRVLKFKYLEELPVKAIARRMDMSAKAVESLLTRARGAFREVYARQFDRPELRLSDS